MTVVVNKDQADFDVYIGRPGKWGNPFIIGKDGTREQVIAKYEEWIKKQPQLLASLDELRGKRLGCFCKPLACHGDVLARLIKEKVRPRVANTEQEVIVGDCLAALRGLEDSSVDALATDPPAGIDFMGREWDSDKGGRRAWIDWLAERLRECLRVLKPGGYGVVWSIPRTSHWTGTACEDAGFEVIDVVAHLYGQGMPKSKNIGRAIDIELCDLPGRHCETTLPKGEDFQEGDHICPPHPCGSDFQGAGTGLKPAREDWWLIRKPFEGTYARCALDHGTGALNIDACRVKTGDNLNGGAYSENGAERYDGAENWRFKREGGAGKYEQPEGRWPSNLILSHSENCVLVGERSVQANGSIAPHTQSAQQDNRFVYNNGTTRGEWQPHGNGDGTETVETWDCVEGCPVRDLGDRARYFYVAKPARGEKEAGLEHLAKKTAGEATGGRKDGSAGLNSPRAGAGRTSGARNHHPTVKGIELMRYLLRLITPKGGVVLDPFAGSGSTGCAAALEGFDCVMIEREREYAEIARARVAQWRKAAGLEDGDVAEDEQVSVAISRALRDYAKERRP